MTQSSSLLTKLSLLEKQLMERIRGQDHLIPRIVSLLQRGELGLRKPSRPRGSFLFLGPTGVGKTEITLAFTHYLFGEDRLRRFDMSEFQTQESLSLLLGGKLGERGLLALAYDQAPTGTLLFDEIEKAHPRVLDLFLQILDAARVTMANGETLDLSGFYIVFTSNIGSAGTVYLQYSSFATMERHVLARAQQQMRPELFARMGEKLVFRKLDFETQLEIARLLLDQELAFFESKGYSLELTEEVLPFLVRKGFHAQLGARPMRDAVERFVGEAVMRSLMAGAHPVGRLAVAAKGEHLVVIPTNPPKRASSSSSVV